VGRYLDVLQRRDGALEFVEKRCVYDSVSAEFDCLSRVGFDRMQDTRLVALDIDGTLIAPGAG
jgi:hypothetical protein